MLKRSIITVLFLFFFLFSLPIFAKNQESFFENTYSSPVVERMTAEENVGELGSIYNIWGHAFDIITDGTYAYVTTLHTGLRIMDISTPSAPAEVGYFLTGGYCLSTDVANGYAYVACGTKGMKIIDVTDPANPVLVGHYETNDNVRGVSVSGNHAFLADNWNGLTVVDVSDRSNPTFVTSLYPGPYGYASDVVVDGSYAYLANTSDGLRIIDISNPASPTSVGHYSNWNDAYRLNKQDQYVYVAYGDGGVDIVNVLDPENPTLADHWDTAFHVSSVTPSGDYAFVANNAGGLWILDISNPTNINVTGNTLTLHEAECALPVGNTVFLAGGEAGLESYSIATISNPTLIGQYNQVGGILGVASSGEHIYVAKGTEGVSVVSKADPENLVETGICEYEGFTVDIAAEGNYAYAADNEFGLRVIDVSNPASPAETGSLALDAPLGVAVSGDYAYVADGNSGLRVVNVVNPIAPLEAGTYNTAGYSRDVVVSGDYAYVADSHTGVTIVDISSPATPTEVGTYNTSGSAFGVALNGNILYVADYSGGVKVLDVSNPASPSQIAIYSVPDQDYHYSGDPVAQRINISGNYAYVAYGIAGLRILDITTPSSPVETGYYYSDGVAYDVAIATDDEIILAESYFLTVLGYSSNNPPTAFDMLSPTNGATIINYSATLIWSRSTDPDPGDILTYEVQWDVNSDFSTMSTQTTTDTFLIITDIATLLANQSGTSLDDLPDDTDLYWRVKVSDTQENEIWSNQGETGWSFSTSVPEVPNAFDLVEPVDESQFANTDTTFVWRAAVDPDPGDFVQYTFHLATDELFTENHETFVATDTSLVITDLVRGETYWWKVWAEDLNAGGTWSTQVWSFTINELRPPSPFSLVSPADDSVLDTLNFDFTWRTSSDPDFMTQISYTLEVSTDNTFPDSTSSEFDCGFDTTLATIGWEDDTEYWWRVQAFNLCEETTYSAETWSFQTRYDERQNNFHLLSPEDGETIGGEGNFETVALWVTSHDPDPYDTVVYDVVFDLMTPAGNDTILRYSSGTDTSLAFNIPDSLGWDYWEGEIPVNWYVESITTMDTVRSSNELTFAMSPHLLVNEFTFSVPGKYEITALYPNPFNPTLSVKIGLPESAPLKVTIFNVMGQKIADIVDTEMVAGYHTFIFNGSALSSGVYFVRATSPGKMNVLRKVTLLK